ncbi:hypothetical protein MMC28_006486 [Mycoblastus sanguinarius]|nr:hypothetical protein [Mycoblastus sanguinarius]
MARKSRRKPQLLSSTRPRNLKPTPSLSSRATRTLVRSHHTLRKQLSIAVTKGDTTEAESLKAKIKASGGLRRYQEASIQGQSPQRGGDTSKVLVNWLDDEKKNATAGEQRKLRMLEVGALRIDNQCSRSGMFDMERIDLHSQHPEIREQDFMQRPIPAVGELENEGYDVLSLSLVVNFVEDAATRGDMLKRVGGFLRLYAGVDQNMEKLLPSLFLVLPAPCVTNSRYLDEERLEALMERLGYTRTKRKMSAKLIYYLWRYNGTVTWETQSFKKTEVRIGSSRNNFAIVLS